MLLQVKGGDQTKWEHRAMNPSDQKKRSIHGASKGLLASRYPTLAVESAFLLTKGRY
jgi:hypothetical protein